MSWQSDRDPHKLVRATDPDTSREAAEAAAETLRRDCLRVYAYFQRKGRSTDLEMQWEFGDMRSTWRSRRNDLTQPPWCLIRDSGEKKFLDGRKRIIWELVPESERGLSPEPPQLSEEPEPEPEREDEPELSPAPRPWRGGKE